MREEYGRVTSGSQCEIGDLCSVIPIAVIAVVVIGLILGLVKDIDQKGAKKGLCESSLSKLLLAISVYVGFIGLLAWVVIFVSDEFGKEYGFLVIATFILFVHLWFKSNAVVAKNQVSEIHLDSEHCSESSGSTHENMSANNTSKEESVDYDIPTIKRKNKK